MDRNIQSSAMIVKMGMSLSARRAWIEISMLFNAEKFLMSSLSARRAWIEMFDVSLNYKEVLCRSPQGERG